MSAPETMVNHPIRVSGRSSSPATSTSMPSSSTPAVWAKATVRPRATAWRIVPPEPTR